MFLRFTTRKKNGKEHRYWSIVENKRCAGGGIVQKPVLYLGEINDQQEANWQKTIEIFEHGQTLPRTVALFPAERSVESEGENVLRIKLSEMELCHPRQWGACWALLPALLRTGPGSILEGTPASQPQGNSLGFNPADALRLSPDGSRQRMAFTQTMV